jgi:2'-5' RNA ligase
MRLFLAIPCGTVLTEKLNAVQRRLRKESCKGSFPPLEKLHLTLVFLGETPEKRMPELLQTLSGVSGKSFLLRCTGLGRFLDRSGELWWMGTEETPELLQLSTSLRTALFSAGFSYDRKEFRPHITLGRRVRLLPDVHPEQWNFSGLSEKVTCYILMESCRLPDGKYAYLPVKRFRLA